MEAAGADTSVAAPGHQKGVVHHLDLVLVHFVLLLLSHQFLYSPLVAGLLFYLQGALFLAQLHEIAHFLLDGMEVGQYFLLEGVDELHCLGVGHGLVLGSLFCHQLHSIEQVSQVPGQVVGVERKAYLQCHVTLLLPRTLVFHQTLPVLE